METPKLYEFEFGKDKTRPTHPIPRQLESLIHLVLNSIINLYKLHMDI
jgi:hypothetical protein